MEKDGIALDIELCRKRADEETEKYTHIARKFHDLTGEKFIDSGKALARIYEKMGVEVPRTEKGNPSITDHWLENSDNSLSLLIKEYRTHYKVANTYYKNYLFFADDKGIIRPNMKQSGTATGRFSYSDANLQNVPAGSEVRKVFIPRPNYYFASIDFSQQEFRMALDYAKEAELAELITNGHDPHTATAEVTGLTRQQAKTLNFATLYGSGGAKIAGMIGVSVEDGKAFRKQYFKALPFLSEWIKSTNNAARNREIVRTWAGRRLLFPDGDFSYKAVNAVIQGGCADVSKFAMLEIHKALKDKKSRMVLQVHDEFIFEIHESERGIESELAKIMESIFPYRILKLTTSISTSEKSWGDID
jgi:DNA polymerase-1